MNFKKSLLASFAIIAAVLAIPTTASAGVFCVGPGANCSFSPVAPFPQDAAGITAAINAATAHAGDDVLYVAAGLYPITSSTFPALPASSDDLGILGAGAGQTIFTGTSDGSAPLIDLQLPNADSGLNAVSVNVSFTSNFAYGVVVHRGQFNDFALNQTGTVSNGAPASAIDLRNGTRAHNGTITNSGNASGLSLHDGQTYVQRLSFTGSGAGAGVFVYGNATSSMTSMRFVGYGTGLRVGGGNVDITDSLVDMQSLGGVIGFYIEDQNTSVGSSINVDAARNTIIGSADSIGIYLNTQEAIDSSTGSYKDMLIYGPDPGFASWLCPGTAGSTLDFDFGGLATNVAPQFGTHCSANSVPPAAITLTESPFVNFAARSLRPAWNSPIVDAGSTTAEAWANDLDEGSHRVDGDNDGTITSDIGAFEYQAYPPSGSISAPSSATIGQAIAFTHSMTDPDPTNAVTGVLWNFGDGSSSTQQTPSHSYAAAGDYTVTVSATNMAGSVGTASAQVAVPAIPATPLPASPPTAKIVSKPKKSFKIGNGGFVVAKKGVQSFSLKFTNAVRANIKLQSIGKKRKLSTVKGSQIFKLPTSSTTVKFSFSGRWNKKKLAAGSYRVGITPVSAAGISGKPVYVDIKLKK